MNKLELGFQGGDPLTLDDLEFMRDGLAEAIQGLASIWQSGSLDSIIISGLVGTVSLPNVTYTSGFIVVNSELYYVPAQTIAVVGGCIDISETIDTNGDETFEDLSVHSTYKVRRGLLKTSTGGPNEIDIADFTTLSNRIIQITNCVVDNSTPWVAVMPTAAWNIPSTYNGYPNVCEFKRDIGNTIVLRGMIKNTDTGATITACSLPAGFRPSKRKFLICYSDDLSKPVTVVVEVNGDIGVYGISSNNIAISVDQVRFTLDT